MEQSAAKPLPSPIALRDFYGIFATTLGWLIVAGALALASLQQLPPSLAIKAFASTLCGPFAFFDSPPRSWGSNLAGALFCTAPIMLHSFVRRTETAVIAGMGVSLWFLIGAGLTFIGV